MDAEKINNVIEFLESPHLAYYIEHYSLQFAIVALIKDLQADNERMRTALEKLAKLGNGDRYGNSDGNVIAQDALKGGS